MGNYSNVGGKFQVIREKDDEKLTNLINARSALNAAEHEGAIKVLNEEIESLVDNDEGLNKAISFVMDGISQFALEPYIVTPEDGVVSFSDNGKYYDLANDIGKLSDSFRKQFGDEFSISGDFYRVGNEFIDDVERVILEKDGFVNKSVGKVIVTFDGEEDSRIFDYID